MKNSKFKINLTLAIIILDIIWTPLQTVLFQVDSAGRVVSVLTIFAVFLNASDINKLCFRKPMSYYLLLAPYMFINGLVNNSQLLYDTGFKGVFVMFNTIFMATMVMLLTVVLCHRNFNKTLNCISIAILLYCLMCVFSGSMTQYLDEGERLESVVNINEVALMLAVAFSFVLIQYLRGQIILTVFIIISAFLLVVNVLTGSRMGFGMTSIIIVVSILLLRNKRSVSSTVVTVLLLVIGYFLLNFVMDNTYVGERMMETSTQIENNTYASGTIFDKYGDRGIQYYLSWPFFLQHPIFGIGFHQWIKYSPTGHISHSEFMVQYLECGLVAFVLYLLFFIGITSKLRRNWKYLGSIDLKTAKVLYATMLAIAFGNTVLWTYNCRGIFAIYGLAFAIIIKSLETQKISSIKRALTIH